MPAEAETLNCPMCGAPAKSDATQCDHCGARLATVACPSCFGLIFLGAKFCSHCGAKVERVETDPAVQELCPRCRINLQAVTIGKCSMRECTHCEGLWVDLVTLQTIVADREEQSAVLGVPAPIAEPDSHEIEVVRYLPCPVCKQLMNRVNFANCSHVIVDVCRQHGTWFDKDELRKIVEFIRAGGIDQARSRQIEELQHQQAELKNVQTFVPMDSGGGGSISSHIGRDIAIGAAAVLLKVLFRL
jgi:Zn-finger nucleic acid-binding protein